jgi:hypothetical protein
MLQHNATHDAACKQLLAKYDYLNLLKIEADNHQQPTAQKVNLD